MDRVLSMCEYWMLLTMDKSEIEEVTRFRNPDARAAQADGIGAQGAARVHRRRDDFRDRPVPVQERAPALPIALAMTEGHEKPSAGVSWSNMAAPRWRPP